MPVPTPAPAPRMMRRIGGPVLRIVLWALAWRMLSAAVAFVENVAFPKYGQEFASPFGGTRAFWDLFTRFDSGWYFQIARYGYTYVEDSRGTIAYFPAYPLLMRYVGRLFGPSQADVYFGGIFVSWTAFVLAMIGIYYLARLELPQRRAERAVLLTAIFPFAFFFGVVYTESLFLAATVWAFYCFRTRRWLLGGACGALATATRVNGIMMWPALAWIAWSMLGPRSQTADRPHLTRERLLAVCGLLLVGAGIGAYSFYVYQLSGNPLAWRDAIQHWNYYPGGLPWLALGRLVRELLTRPIVYIATVPQAPYDTLNGLTALLFVGAIPFVWARFGAAFGLFMAVNLWLPLSSGQYEGLGRYCSVLFPFFIWVASLRSRGVAVAAVGVSALLYTLCMAFFTNIHPLF